MAKAQASRLDSSGLGVFSALPVLEACSPPSPFSISLEGSSPWGPRTEHEGRSSCCPGVQEEGPRAHSPPPRHPRLDSILSSSIASIHGLSTPGPQASSSTQNNPLLPHSVLRPEPSATPTKPSTRPWKAGRTESAGSQGD